MQLKSMIGIRIDQMNSRKRLKMLFSLPSQVELDQLFPFKRAELVMKTFKNDSSMRIPTVISQLIAFYLVDESIPKSRIRLVNYVKEAFDKDLIVEIPTVISELIAFYLVDELTLGLWDNPGKQSKALTSIENKE